MNKPKFKPKSNFFPDLFLYKFDKYDIYNKPCKNENITIYLLFKKRRQK